MMSGINEDLQRERADCYFSIQEMTEFIDGGPDNTKARKEREKTLLSIKDDIFGGIPDSYLSHKEKYEEAIRKAVALFSLLRREQSEGNSNLSDYRELMSSLLSSSVSHDGTPLGLHYIMFMPVLMSQCDDEQTALWLPRAWDCSIIGSYAQTELGHGTFIRGLETTATYDPATKEFVLNSPTLSSYKWWAGSLGHTANYVIVIAQLYTGGRCHGIHPFIVQVRDEATHAPLPGVSVGEIGPRMGLNAVNNGFLGFRHVRIPRRHMLMKHAQVLEDGTYVKSRNSKLRYGGMVFVRVVIVYDSVNYLSKAVTIATRYSAVRRQSQIHDDEPECQILDFVVQQHKIFVGIAACHAMKLTANMLWDTFNAVNEQLSGGNMERLPELHALACCLKAVSTADTAAHVERCRLACGGHGYMHCSNLPLTYSLVTASCTYEGDNTVLLLQTARFLVKTWQQINSQALTPTVAYLKATISEGFPKHWENSVEGIIRGFQTVSMRKISSCVEDMQRRIESGLTPEDAWNRASVQLVSAAETHCRVIIISTFHEQVRQRTARSSAPVRAVLTQLVELYAVYWTLETLRDLLRFTQITNQDIDTLQRRYEELLLATRPVAVGLVDSFDIMDELLQSTLGAYDGRVYERLMEEAMKSPLNKEPVNQSFHKYLKPFMQGKL